MPVICAPPQRRASRSTQGRSQPSTLVGVQGVRSLFESPKGRLDADPASTQELVQLSSKDAEATPGVVLGEFAGLEPPADGLARYKRDPGGICNRVEGRQFEAGSANCDPLGNQFRQSGTPQCLSGAY